MANNGYRDRGASQQSLKQAIDGLDKTPSRKSVRPSRAALRMEALAQRITPLRLAVVLVGLTAAIVGSALI